MKKSLLMGLMACFTALSASAVEAGDKVLTPQGKFLIQGADECTNGTFADGFAGWTANAGEGVGFDQIFSYDSDVKGIVSLNNANTSGMYYAFTPTTGRSYVVSITLTQAEATVPNQNTRTNASVITSATNFIQVHMNGSADEPGTPAGGTNRVEGGAPTEIIPGEPITLNFALVGDEIDGRTAFIEFIGMNTNITINKVEIHQAIQLGYSRELQPTIDYAKTILNCYDWSKVEDPDEWAASLDELIAAAEEAAANDESSQDDIDGALADLQGGITDFCKGLMDDYLVETAADKLPLGSKKAEKLGNIGCWKGYGGGSGRLCTYVNALSEAGHYQQANSWGNGNGCIGIYTQMELAKGVYVFSMDTRAAARENVKNSWDFNAGLEFAKAKMYCAAVPEEGEVNVDEAIAVLDYFENPAETEKHWIVVEIKEPGKYEFGIRTWAKDGYETLKYGSCLLMKDAAIYAKTAAAYSQAQLAYEADVRGQIKAATDAIEKAEGYIADETKSWGKEELAAAIVLAKETVAPYVEMDQDAIIDTYDKEIYNSSKPLTGDEALDQDGTPYRMLAYTVYQEAVKDILEANRQFEAKNAHLDNLTAAIESANNTLNERVYSLAEGKAELMDAIATAEQANTELRAAGYSEENAQAADDAVLALNDAVENFKTTVPEECYTTIVDIDFSNQAVQDPETSTWSIEGKMGKMELGNYTQLVNPETGEANGEDNNFTQGCHTNEQANLVDMLRIGNSNATVDLPADLDKNAIVQISFDYYYGNLNGRYAAWKVQSAQYDEETGVTSYKDELGLNCSKYDKKDDYNTFGINYVDKINAVGASGVDNLKIAEEDNKTHITINIDLALNTATCTTSGSTTGTVTWTTATISAAPARFLIGSNYNVAARRCWFDNLKVVTIATDPDAVKGVSEVNAAAPAKVAKMVVDGKVLIKAANGTFTAAGAQVK